MARIFIIGLYSLPSAFYAAYIDYTEHRLYALGLTVLLYVVLGLFAFYQQSVPLMICGAMLTACTSYVCAILLLPEESNGYFKPLTKESLVLIESGLLLVPQLAGWKIGQLMRGMVK